MPILDIQNVTKKYNNGKLALNAVNLSIEKGEFIALLGMNGAGKSTLINIIADVVMKTSGKLYACGIDYDIDRAGFKRNLGIVPQEVAFDPFFSAYKTLKIQQGLYGKPFNHDQIISVLTSIGLEDKIYAEPRTLSGGMRRRLSIAKAIINNPPILILDEPTAGVDITLRQQLWQLIKKLNNQGTTIILTTHYLEEAEELCNKIAIIDQGELIQYQDKQQLLHLLDVQYANITLNSSLTHNINDFNYTLDNDNKYVILKYQHDEELGLFLEQLYKLQYKILALTTKKPNLEDVFVKLTS